MGPQMLQDVEESMLARPATLKDPGTPDQIVLEQHTLTHFPSQSWCKVCIESRGRDSPEALRRSRPGARLQDDGHTLCCCRNIKVGT